MSNIIYGNIDLNNNELKNILIDKNNIAPSGSEGKFYYNTSTKKLYIYTDSWRELLMEIPPSGNDMNTIANDFTYIETFHSTLNGSILPLSNSTTGGAPAPTLINSESGHPGIRRIRTNNAGLSSRSQDILNSTTTGPILIDTNTITGCLFKVRPPLAGGGGTPNQVQLGFCSGTFNIPTTLGIYWFYDRALYGDNFFRVRVTKGGTSYQKVTTAALSGTAEWATFGIIVDTTVSPTICRFFYGKEGVSPVAYSQIETITKTEVTLAGVTFPDTAADIMTISQGIQKPASHSIQSTLDIDTIVFSKQIY